MTNESRPIWTEGICGDGAAILRDGVMQPIEEVIAALNAAELSQPEPGGLPPRVGHILRLAEIIREVDGNHDKGAAALAEAILSHPGSRWSPTIEPVPVAERLPGPEDCAPWPGEPDATHWAWAGKCVDGGWEWFQLSMLGLGSNTLGRIIAGGGWTHWARWDALPVPGAEVQS